MYFSNLFQVELQEKTQILHEDITKHVCILCSLTNFRFILCSLARPVVLLENAF